MQQRHAVQAPWYQACTMTCGKQQQQLEMQDVKWLQFRRIKGLG